MKNSLLIFIYRLKELILRRIRTSIVCNSIDYPPPSISPKILGKVYLRAKHISMGNNVKLYPGVYLWGNNITIGNNVDIGIGTIIHSTNGIHIGDNTVIAGQCYIIDSNHGCKKDELIIHQESVAAENGIRIGEDVWIGAQCLILKGACINNHAVI